MSYRYMEDKYYLDLLNSIFTTVKYKQTDAIVLLLG